MRSYPLHCIDGGGWDEREVRTGEKKFFWKSLSLGNAIPNDASLKSTVVGERIIFGGF